MTTVDKVAGPLLEIDDAVMHFKVREGMFGERRVVRAVDGVSLTVEVAETVGIVGESGCGKSTLARVAVGLYRPTSGSVRFDGIDIYGKTSKGGSVRSQLQMVFQDPAGSLNPRLTIGTSVSEPLWARGERVPKSLVHGMLDLVGLKPEHAARYPHQLSGGQQQRACIARALAGNPRLVVHDESVSSLDVSLQAQVLNLLRDLQQRLGLTYIFISHDLAAVQAISGRIAVMYLGQLVELAPAEEFRSNPLHPYSIALRSAVPLPDPVRERRRERIILRGDVPSPIDPPPGCRFHTRCPQAQDVCREAAPPFAEHRSGHWAACHFAGEFDRALTRRNIPITSANLSETG